MWLLAHHHERFRELNRSIYMTFYGDLSVLMRAADPDADDAEIGARARLAASVLDGVAIQIHAAGDDDETACDDLLERATNLVLAIAVGRAGKAPSGTSAACGTR